MSSQTDGATTPATSQRPPFTCDVVGSFLRPPELLAARERTAGGRLGADELRAVEDAAIEDLMARLVSLGYRAVTDGEFRRGGYHSDFLGGLDGIDLTTYKMTLFGEPTTVGSTSIVDRISWNPEHPFLAHFAFAKATADRLGAVAKLDIPGPNMVLLDTITTEQDNVYGKDVDALAADFVEVYRGAIRSFHEAGCRYLQLDDPVWVSVCDPGFCAKIEAAGFSADRLKGLFFETAQAILADRPADMAITTHLCQGNLRSRKFYDTTYDKIADTIFRLPFDGFFMEFDEEKYCDFSLLDKVRGQKVVLGVASTQTGELEGREVLVNRVRRAAEHLPLDQLGVSTQCGFASTSEGNLITADEQWAKLALLKDVEREVWG